MLGNPPLLPFRNSFVEHNSGISTMHNLHIGTDSQTDGE